MVVANAAATVMYLALDVLLNVPQLTQARSQFSASVFKEMILEIVSDQDWLQQAVEAVILFNSANG